MIALLVTLLWVSALWLGFGALASIAMVGKARKPLEHTTAVITVITSAVIVGSLVAAAIVVAGVAS